jgi:hypothetical protein
VKLPNKVVCHQCGHCVDVHVLAVRCTQEVKHDLFDFVLRNGFGHVFPSLECGLFERRLAEINWLV